MEGAEVSKKILIDVQLKADQVKKELPILNQAVDKLTQSQKDLEKQGQKNSQAYIDNATQIRQLKSEIRDVNKYIDDSTRAFNAENGSIQQNRALLSVLTTDYVKVGAVTKDQTDKVKKLSDTLKEQEKVIGQQQRSVGSYADAIQSVTGKISGMIPGGSQLTSVLQSFGKSFGSVATSAGEAETGISTVTMGVGLMSVGFIAAAAAVAGLKVWLDTIPSIGLKSERAFAGVRGAVVAFFNDVGKNVGFKELYNDMKNAYNGASELKGAFQELDREKQTNDEQIAQIDRQIAQNMLLMRNKKTSLEEAKKIDAETGELDQKRAELKIKQAKQEMQMAVEQSVIGKKLRKDQADAIKSDLLTRNTQAAQELELQDKVNKGTADSIHKAVMDMQAAYAERDQTAQKSQNRLDILEQRFSKAATKAIETEAQLLTKVKKAEAEADNVRLSSKERMIAANQSAFAKEFSDASDHYRQLILKRQEFLEAYSHMTPEKQAAYSGAAKKNVAAIQQLEQESYVVRLKLASDYQKQLMQDVTQANNELVNIQIQNIKDTEQRQLAQLTQEEANEIDGIKRKYANAQEQEVKLQADIDTVRTNLQHARNENDKKAYQQELTTLEAVYKAQETIVGDYEAEMYEKQKSYAEKRKQLIIDGANKIRLAQDQVSISALQNNSAAFINDAKLLAARKKEINDTYQPLIDAAAQKGESTDQLEQERNDKTTKADQDYKNARLAVVQQMVDQSFSIISNGLKRESEARIQALENQKNAELQNANLTNGQKLLIEQKYKKKENAEKVKEFNEEKAVNAAKTEMSTAVAVMKAAPNIPLQVLTAAMGAAELAVVLAQKAPAYSTGGLHYVSDGRGTLLRGPGTGTSDSMNAKVSNGEAVINAVSTSMFTPLLSAINVAGGGVPLGSNTSGRFSTGGINLANTNSTYTPTVSNGSTAIQPVTATMHPNDMAAIMALSERPVYVDMVTFNSAQGRYAKANSRGNA